MKKEILILCKTNLQRDPRVLKQIEALHQDYNLTCLGTVKSMHTGVQNDLDLFELDSRGGPFNRIVHVAKLITKRHESLYWTVNNSYVYSCLKENSYDLIICNETESLPIAHRLADKKEIPIYCDLHEFYLDDRLKGSFSKAQLLYEKWIFTNHLSHIKHFTTVSPQIIKLYKERYNITCTLLDNACKFYDLSPKPTSNKNIRIISHGAAIPARKLEVMIEAVSALDSSCLLYTSPSPRDRQKSRMPSSA